MFPSAPIAHTHTSFIEHNGSIWAVVPTATDHVISASADGTIALHASSTTSAIPETEGLPSIQQMQANPGARIWTLPRQPLGFVGLSVAVSDPASEPAPEIARRALCNSMSGKTILVDFGSGEILGAKESLEKDPNTGVMPTEPGAIRLNEHIFVFLLLNLLFNSLVWSTSLSPDAKTYASTSGSSGNVCIHDATPGSPFGSTISALSIGRNKWGMHLRHNQDGSKVAMSTESGTIYVFDTQKQALVSTFASHAMCVRMLSWSADGKVRFTSMVGLRSTILPSSFFQALTTKGSFFMT